MDLSDASGAWGIGLVIMTEIRIIDQCLSTSRTRTFVRLRSRPFGHEKRRGRLGVEGLTGEVAGNDERSEYGWVDILVGMTAA
jgi:hypothetical protein